MDATITKIEELRNLGPDRLKEVEEEARKELLNLRLDFTMATPSADKMRKMRKTLARILTVMNEKKNSK